MQTQDQYQKQIQPDGGYVGLTPIQVPVSSGANGGGGTPSPIKPDGGYVGLTPIQVPVSNGANTVAESSPNLSFNTTGGSVNLVA